MSISSESSGRFSLCSFTSASKHERMGCEGPGVITSSRLHAAESEFLNFKGAQESIPRNQLSQPLLPGGLVQRPYSYSVSSPHKVNCFKIPAQVTSKSLPVSTAEWDNICTGCAIHDQCSHRLLQGYFFCRD